MDEDDITPAGGKSERSAVMQVQQAAAFAQSLPDDYTLLNDAYSGTGGFKDGSYIVPHPREPADKYSRRKYMSYYCNYVKPCVNAHVDPVFREYPVREYKANQYMDAFLENVDCKGTKIDRFMKRAAIRAKLFGSVFIVVDNFSEGAQSVKDALDNRKFPYIYLLRPSQVKDYATDRFGNLSWIKYQLAYTEVEDGEKKNKTVMWEWTRETWKKTDSDGIETKGNNRIGEIPVVALQGAYDEENNLTPQSDFYPIARVNLAIFNACSELRERNRNQAFSVLTYQLGEGDDYEQAQDLTFGTADVLLFPNTAGSAPSYITPPAEPSETLMSEIRMLIEEIYRMSERANVTGVQTESSGLAKEWDHQSLHQTIAEFAKNLEEAEERIAMLAGKYLNAELGYNAKYSDDYGVVDVSAELDKVTKALALAVGGQFDKEVKKQAARTVLKDQEDDVINAVIKEIEQQQDDALYSKSEAD